MEVGLQVSWQCFETVERQDTFNGPLKRRMVLYTYAGAPMGELVAHVQALLTGHAFDHPECGCAVGFTRIPRAVGVGPFPLSPNLVPRDGQEPPRPPPPMQDIQGEAPIDWEPTERVVDEDEDEVEDACSDDEETGDADSRSAHSSAEKECKIQMCIVQFVYGHVHREARTAHARLRSRTVSVFV